MSKISIRGIKTSVNLLINTMAVLGLVFLPSYSLGQTATPAAAPGQIQPQVTMTADQLTNLQNTLNNQRKCDNLDADIKAKKDDIQKACHDLGAKNCYTAIKNCDDTSSDSDSTDTTSTDSSSGNSTPANNKCPSLSGKDYKDVQKQLEAAQKESEDMQKQLQDAQKNMMDTRLKAQQQINDAQSQLKQAVLDTASQNQQRLTAFSQTQAQTNQQIQQLQASILKAQQDIANQSQIEANALNIYSNASATSACTAKMNAAKSDGTCVASSSTNYIATGNARRDCLVNVYNTCITDYAQKRQAAATAFSTAQQADNLAINQAQASITDQQTILKNQQAQEQTDNQNAQIALSNKQQDIAKMQQQTTDQINQSVQEFTSLQQSLAQRQQEINKQIEDDQKQLNAGIGGASNSSTISAAGTADQVRGDLLGIVSDLQQGNSQLLTCPELADRTAYPTEYSKLMTAILGGTPSFTSSGKMKVGSSTSWLPSAPVTPAASAPAPAGGAAATSSSGSQ